MTTAGRERLREALPCGFVFDGGHRCLAPADHDVHHGKWKGREPNHDYEPWDRRIKERRAALAHDRPSESGLRENVAIRIDALRKAIDIAVDDLNQAWGGFGPNETLERAIGILQRARTADDIVQGRDWPPVVLAERLGVGSSDPEAVGLDVERVHRITCKTLIDHEPGSITPYRWPCTAFAAEYARLNPSASDDEETVE